MTLQPSALKFGLLGCGTMGRCILTGLLEHKAIEASSIIASVQSEVSQEQLLSAYPGIQVFVESNDLLVSQCDVILIW